MNGAGLAPSSPTRWAAAGLVLRHNALFVGLVAAGAVLRALVAVAYPQAFMYTDSFRYLEFSHGWRVDFMRQAGYSLFLKAVEPAGPPAVVSTLQHLLGLGIAVAVYCLLRRRAVPPWLAAIAVAPVTLDAFELSVEHFLLAETLFTSLLVAGLLALLWPRRLGPWPAALAGGLLAAGAATRMVALPLVLATVAFLAVRRVGWRAVAAFSLAAGAVLGGYAVWFHHDNGHYGFSTVEGTFLYGRIAPVVDCDHLRLTPRQRRLCPRQPVGVRPARGDWYVFNAASPIRRASDDAELRDFVVTAVGQRPGPVAVLVIGDVARYFLPAPVEPDWVCAREGLTLPARPPSGGYDWCKPNPRQSFDIAADPATMPATTALTRLLGAYGHVVSTPAPLMGMALLLVVAALVWRPGRRATPRTADVVLVGGWGFGLIVVAMVGAQYDVRYGLPSLALLPAAGALAAWRLWRLRSGAAAANGLPARGPNRPGGPGDGGPPG